MCLGNRKLFAPLQFGDSYCISGTGNTVTVPEIRPEIPACPCELMTQLGCAALASINIAAVRARHLLVAEQQSRSVVGKYGSLIAESSFVI
jgi:hypothetical protein